MLFWLGKYVVLGPWLRLLFRPRLEGVEKLPLTGPAILASNHLAFSDSVFLPLVTKRHIVFLAKAEYFNGKGLKGLASRIFFSGMGAVPIDRSSGSAAKAALETGERILREGSLLGIYPEGTRSPDGKLYRGKTGVARLALITGVPVIPVAMLNTHLVQPAGRKLPRIVRVKMVVGEPLDFSRYKGMAGDRYVERAVTDQIIYELQALSGQKYVDTYASKVKSALLREKAESEAADN